MPTDACNPDILVRVVGYRANEHSEPLNLTVRRGERIGLAGASGSGKTTLLRLVAGYAPGAGQTIHCEGLTVTGRVAHVPQQTAAGLSPFLRARTQVGLVATGGGPKVTALLEAFGLGSDRLQRSHPSEMSGGERQRVLWAQAMAMAPDVFLADEPTADLDYETASEVLSVADRNLRGQNSALLIASHDESVFDRIGCSRVVRLTPSPPPPATNRLPNTGRANQTPVVVAAAVTKSLAGRAVLKDVSLCVAPGEFIALCGRSGSGKSTLASCLAGHSTFQQGAVQFHPALEGLATWRRVQLVQQHPSQSLNPRQKVLDAVLECGSERAFELIAEFELAGDLLNRRTAQLSEGQRSRVAIARHMAAVASWGLVILDESLSALDDPIALRVLSIVRAEQEKHSIGVLWITHHLKIAHLMADRVLTMREGRFVS